MEVSRRNQTGSGNTATGVQCDPCLLLNKNINAKHYCVECDEFFCNNCCSVHKMSKLSRNHKILIGDEMPQQKLVSTEENVCSLHKGKILEYYCKMHKNFFCGVCLTVEHKTCSIEYIDDIVQDFDASTGYISLIEKITSLLQQLKYIKKTSTRHSQDLQTVYTQFISDVKSFRAEINKFLDSMETAILKEAQNVKEFDTKATQTVSTTCDTMTTDINEIVSNLDKHKQYKQQRQLVISAKKAETLVSDLEHKMADISSQNKIRNYEFHKNEEMLHLLQSMCNLGTLLDREKEGGKTKMERKEKENVKLVNKDPKSVRASYVGQINVKHSEDKYDCDITGSVMIDPYRIVLTDCHNYSVKLVNVDSNSILSYLKLYPPPWDVTCIDKSQLVITCYNELVFVNVGQTLTVNKELQVNGDCRGIIFNDNQLFVSFDEPETAVKLISLHGEILKTFSTDQNGQPLFKRPWYICLSNSKSTLFVSDCETNTVTSVDFKGKVQNVYRDTNLEYPYGLTVDRYDNIYIAGRDSHNIHQISTQCRPIQILLDQTQGIVYPQSVTYCETENKLYISHFLGSTDNILSVYQLQ